MLGSELMQVKLPSVKEVFAGNPEYVKLLDNISKAIEESGRMVKVSADSLGEALHYVKNYKTLDKRIEELRKMLKQPFLDKGREIDEFCKSIAASFYNEMKRLESGVMDVKRAMEEEARRRAEEERRRIEEDNLRRAIEEEERRKKAGDVSQVEIAETPEIKAAEVKISELNTSGAYTRKYPAWSYKENFDIKKLPLQYIQVNEAAITLERKKYPNDFRGDAPSIPGIEFNYKETLI